jgi:hypothetical protein
VEERQQRRMDEALPTMSDLKSGMRKPLKEALQPPKDAGADLVSDGAAGAGAAGAGLADKCADRQVQGERMKKREYQQLDKLCPPDGAGDDEALKACERERKLTRPPHRDLFEWTPQACVCLLEGVRQKSFVSPCRETLNTEVGDGGYLWRMQEFMAERLRASTPARLWATLPKDFGPTADEIHVKLNHLMLAYGSDHQGFNECERACMHAVVGRSYATGQ